MLTSRARGFQNKPLPGVQVNHAHPLARGLAGCWLFNEGAGSLAQDISGNGNHGVLTDISLPWEGTPNGGGVGFDGVNDTIIIPHSKSIDFVDTVSVALWMRGDTVLDTWSIFIEKGTGGVDGIKAQINNAGPNAWVQVETSAGVQNPGGQSNLGSIIDGVWHHVAFIVDNGVFRSYRDGVEVKNTTYTHGTGLSNTEDLRFATSRGIINAFNGAFDGLYLYDRALSVDDVKQLYQDPYAMILRPSFAPFTFLEAAGGGTTLHQTTNYQGMNRMNGAMRS